uniref:Uncharacterized protein n=1 Tax=Anguilla anguilla TaxID=7936 RepID=A0A0E9W035_ANGAN
MNMFLNCAVSSNNQIVCATVILTVNPNSQRVCGT